MSWEGTVSQASAEPAARVARPAGERDELVHPAGQQRQPKPLDPADAVTVSVAVGETLASSAAVSSFSAKAVGHMARSSRFASCMKPEKETFRIPPEAG
jgi:hypothetical protein